MFLYGGFIFLFVYALTELMDRHPWAWLWEVAKNVFGLSIIYLQDDWFGASALVPGIKYFLVAYFIASTIVTARFVRERFQTNDFAPLRET